MNSLQRPMRNFLIISDNTRAGAAYKLLDSRFKKNKGNIFLAQGITEPHNSLSKDTVDAKNSSLPKKQFGTFLGERFMQI